MTKNDGVLEKPMIRQHLLDDNRTIIACLVIILAGHLTAFKLLLDMYRS